MMPETCDWCGDPLDDFSGTDGDGVVTVIDGEPHRDASVRAAFHNGTCASEAMSYGWS